MRRTWRLALVVALLGVVLYPTGVRAGGSRPGTDTGSAPVAVALHGNIELFAVHGIGRTVVTHSGEDHAPVVSPNGAAVAFWRGQFTPLSVTRREIMVAKRDLRGVWRVALFSQRPASGARLQGTLTWAPGRQLPASPFPMMAARSRRRCPLWVPRFPIPSAWLFVASRRRGSAP